MYMEMYMCTCPLVPVYMETEQKLHINGTVVSRTTLSL